MRKSIAAVFAAVAALAWLIADVLWPADQRGNQVILIEPPVTEEDTAPAIGWDAQIGEYRSGWRIIDREGFDQTRRVE